MPRRAPDEVTEHRITFGNYERALITEVKEDLEKSFKVATIAAVAVPFSTVTGLGLLGYGIYRGLDGFSFGALGNPFKGTIQAAKDLFSGDNEFIGEDADGEGGYNNLFGDSGVKLHINRITDLDWWLQIGDHSGYVDKKDR